MQEASKEPKTERKEAPPASPTSALPPSGAVPPWEKDGAPDLAGDGLDELRAQARAHVPLPREAKLAAALHELQKEEAERLRWFEKAKKSGDQQEIDSAVESWKWVAEKLERLRRDPDEFVRRHGYLYNLE
ncbi:hypothetical protein COHA_006233 [Chlorella ohadii]|uniref:Uncharacterized protein n=1 Tax=Chlorella ohadii TaxID=2649997 RepID=A0AAD5DLV3_9CHLO|nr:hypothetical protein COHA_006233 [Chlorella ohadii]